MIALIGFMIERIRQRREDREFLSLASLEAVGMISTEELASLEELTKIRRER